MLRLKGFSLIEMLVVLAIISFIVVIATPSFFNGFDSLKVKQTIRTMSANIIQTRASAINTGKQQTWTLDLKNRQFWSSSTDLKKSYPTDIDVEFTTGSRERRSDTLASIRFFPNGSSTGAKLAIQKKNYRYTAQIDWLTGMLIIDE